MSDEESGSTDTGDTAAPSGGTDRSAAAGLGQLTRDVGGDATIVEQFVSDYLSLLDSRLERLAQLIAAGDHDALEVSILSLESTSAMIGATEVVTTAYAVRQAITGPREGVQTAFEALRAAVHHTRQSLSELGFTGPS